MTWHLARIDASNRRWRLPAQRIGRINDHEYVLVTSVAATSSTGNDEVEVWHEAWYAMSNQIFVPGPWTAPPADGITGNPIVCVIHGGNLRRPGATACSATRPGVVGIGPAVSPFALVTRTTLDIPTISDAIYGVTAQATVRPVP